MSHTERRNDTFPDTPLEKIICLPKQKHGLRGMRKKNANAEFRRKLSLIMLFETVRIPSKQMNL